jgi:hypothetical protein
LQARSRPQRAASERHRGGRRIVVGVNALNGPDEIDVQVQRNAMAVYPEERAANREERQLYC